MNSVLSQANETAITRFWRKVVPTEVCWHWIGGKNKNGYGQFQIGGYKSRTVNVHRFAYELQFGVIPTGKEIDHKCRNRACVKPSHLRAISHKENVLCGISFAAEFAKRTYCKHGHLLAGQNLKPSSDRRRCRLCANKIQRNWKRRNNV